MFDIDNLWDPKFKIYPKSKVVTFGSCFAQHIGNALSDRGFTWLSTELPPTGLSEVSCKKFNYNVFSCRTGNIYTTSLLKQWTEWALDISTPPDECWEKEGRYYDPFRPRVEPNGFESIDEMLRSRKQTIASFKQAITESNYFVFTLGLTESWFNTESGYEYPMCPGTVAGEFDSNKHEFKNQEFEFIRSNLLSAIQMMRKVNKQLKFILTVSPVPLTATKSGNHVLLATMESKSILRAVAGQLARKNPAIDYFPSYEIINSPTSKGAYFEPNQRSVNPYGVNFVMDSFFKSLNEKYGISATVKNTSVVKVKKSKEDVVCEEELLAAFGDGK